MKFKKERKLQDNVFTSKIVRIEDEFQDCVLEDRVLENDFGPVSVEAGGKFEAIVEKDGSTGGLVFKAITSANKSEADKANFKFALAPAKTVLLMGTSIDFSCDAREEASRTYESLTLTPLKAAEFKCKIFEEVILDRIKLAIEDWKVNKTDFETEILDPVHFSLV